MFQEVIIITFLLVSLVLLIIFILDKLMDNNKKERNIMYITIQSGDKNAVKSLLERNGYSAEIYDFASQAFFAEEAPFAIDQYCDKNGINDLEKIKDLHDHLDGQIARRMFDNEKVICKDTIESIVEIAVDEFLEL